MRRTTSLPWTRINDFLLQVCAARNLQEFNHLVCAHIADLIPHDFPIVCITLDRKDLLRDGIEHPDDPIDHDVLAVAGDPDTVADFNRHYRYKLPLTKGYILARLVADFRPFARTEFVADFVRPRRIERCLGGWYKRYTIVIPRCTRAALFTPTETEISTCIAPHLENFYDLLTLAAADPQQSRLQSLKTTAMRLGLTPREQEIAILLTERLSMPEIADRLFISRRTVETHAASIYTKLDVRKKRELSEYILSQNPPHGTSTGRSRS